MPPTKKKDLDQRYAAYRKTFRAFRKEGFSISQSILKAAVFHNVSDATVRNAINNRPMNSLKPSAV